MDANLIIEKLRRTEKLLENSRKNHAHQMLLNKTLEIDNDNFKRINEELLQRNETLVSAYKIYEEKWRKLFHSY